MAFLFVSFGPLVSVPCNSVWQASSITRELQGKELMLNNLQENLSEVSRVKEALEKELQTLVSTCQESESQGFWPI